MANSTAGIITRSYKSGSIIYFEGDRSEFIYVLKSGRVILTSIKPDTGDEVKEDVRQGEFFGVKSSLGKYPREETAQTIGDTMVLVMPLADFERLILRNVNVVRKMLKVFSNQLRRIHRMVRSVLGENTVVKPDVELFRIGEYYNSEGSFKHAEYVYRKYVEYYPDGEYAEVAREKMNAAAAGKRTSSAAPISKSPAPSSGGATDFDFDSSGDDFDAPAPVKKSAPVFDFDDQPAAGSARSPLSSEMDDFLMDEPAGGSGGDDFGFDDKFDELEHIKEMYDNAIDLYEIDKFSDALVLFKKIIETGEIKHKDDQKLFEAAHLGAAKCLHKSSKAKEAFDYLGKLVKEYPKSESVKEALFYIGQIFEGAGQKDKAATYYSKVMNMPPKDQMNADAMNRIKKIQSAGK